MQGNPAAARFADTRLAVFVRGSNGGMYQLNQMSPTGPYASFWLNHGGYLTNNPAAVLQRDSRLAAFVQGTAEGELVPDLAE